MLDTVIHKFPFPLNGLLFVSESTQEYLLQRVFLLLRQAHGLFLKNITLHSSAGRQALLVIGFIGFCSVRLVRVAAAYSGSHRECHK